MRLTIDSEQIGAFLGGLLVHAIKETAHHLQDLAEKVRKLSDEELEKLQPALLEEAFDEVMRSFAEPLKSQLLARKADFIAEARRLN